MTNDRLECSDEEETILDTYVNDDGVLVEIVLSREGLTDPLEVVTSVVRARCASDFLRRLELHHRFHSEPAEWNECVTLIAARLLDFELKRGCDCLEAIRTVEKQLSYRIETFFRKQDAGSASYRECCTKALAFWKQHAEEAAIVPIMDRELKKALDLAPVPNGQDSLTETTTQAEVVKRSKSGPTADFKLYRQVREIVQQVAPDGDWRNRLDEVCSALDDACVRVPKSWKKKRELFQWSDFTPNTRPLVTKAIQYRLDRAEQAPENATFS